MWSWITPPAASTSRQSPIRPTRLWTRATPTSTGRISSWPTRCSSCLSSKVKTSWCRTRPADGNSTVSSPWPRAVRFSVFSSGASGASVNGVASTLNSLVGHRLYQQPAAPGHKRWLQCGTEGSADLNYDHFTLIGYTIGTFPATLASRGSCFGAPNTNVDAQLAKNWAIKEKYRLKFSMDFFDLFNHPNFNSSNLEGSGFTSSSPCTAAELQQLSGQPCSPTNNVITSASTPTGFNSAASQNLNQGRNLQYTLRFRF